MVSLFYALCVFFLMLAGFVFHDLNNQLIVVNYYFGILSLQASWIIIASFLAGIIFCIFFTGIELVRARKSLNASRRTEIQLKRELEARGQPSESSRSDVL
jgi:uncharacterized integral membrane protein